MLTSRFLKSRRHADLSDSERARLAEAISEVEAVAARADIVRAHRPLTNSTLLVEGFVSRYLDLPDGKRQILAIHVPGDFIDLHGFLLGSLEHNMAALTPARLAYVPHDRLREITETEPHLGRMLWMSTLIDAAIHREWILSLGRRSALGRLAHLFCELHARLRVAGLADADGYDLPFLQSDLADACGLTPVHINRTLAQLRERKLLDFRRGRVAIHDHARLRAVADFDPIYLHLDSSAPADAR